MNRALTIPAASCLILFVIAFIALHDSLNSAAADNGPLEESPKSVARPEKSLASIPFSGAKMRTVAGSSSAQAMLSNDEARDALTKLTDKYKQPWQEWEKSPTRFYSRAGPRPVPGISTEVTIARPSDPQDAFFLAKIEVKIGQETQPLACMVDRATKRVFVFKDRAWLAGDKWAEDGPTPR